MDKYPTLRLLLRAGTAAAAAAGSFLGVLVFVLVQHVSLPLAMTLGGLAMIGGLIAIKAVFELIAMIIDTLMPQ